jgi:amino acid transporter
MMSQFKISYRNPDLIFTFEYMAVNSLLPIFFSYLFAAARARHLPSFIALLNKTHDSPRAAVFTHVCLIHCLIYSSHSHSRPFSP